MWSSASWWYDEMTASKTESGPCKLFKLIIIIMVLLLLWLFTYIHFQFSSVTQSCPTLCDPVNCSMPGFPVLHYLLEFAQIHVYWVLEAIQPSHPLLPSSPFAFSPSQHQSFPKSQLFASGDLNFGASTSASVLPMNIRGWFSFQTDWFDFLDVQGTLKNLL